MKKLIQELKKDLEIFLAKSEFYKQVYIFFKHKSVFSFFPKLVFSTYVLVIRRK